MTGRFIADGRDDNPDWPCPTCAAWNRDRWGICRACGTPRPPQPDRQRERLERIQDEHRREPNDDD